MVICKLLLQILELLQILLKMSQLISYRYKYRIPISKETKYNIYVWTICPVSNKDSTSIMLNKYLP